MPVALLADYALFHLEADLRWLDLTAARVDELRRTILDDPGGPMIANPPTTIEAALDRSDGSGRASATPILEATDLHKRFGQTEALRGIDFSLAPGEIVAVMGPSGSGKSTLLHCLAGITVPDSGSVDVPGRQHRGDERRRAQPAAAHRLRVRLPVRPARPGAPGDRERRAAAPPQRHGTRTPPSSCAATWFPRLGLDGLEGRRAGEMSGGQAQRVAIARALVVEPAIIFADEPTGSLDSLAGEHVMELLTRAATEQGAAVVLVTHEARVAAYAHREIIVRDGRLSGADPS